MPSPIDPVEVRELAEALTPIADMAILLDVPECELRAVLNDPTTEVYNEYRRAKARVGLMVRQEIIEMAKSGAPSAVAELNNMLAKISTDEP